MLLIPYRLGDFLPPYFISKFIGREPENESAIEEELLRKQYPGFDGTIARCSSSRGGGGSRGVSRRGTAGGGGSSRGGMGSAGAGSGLHSGHQGGRNSSGGERASRGGGGRNVESSGRRGSKETANADGSRVRRQVSCGIEAESSCTLPFWCQKSGESHVWIILFSIQKNSSENLGGVSLSLCVCVLVCDHVTEIWWKLSLQVVYKTIKPQ